MRRRLDLIERCPACRLHYEREEGYWVGAVAVNTGVTILLFAVLFVSAMVATWPAVPWVPVVVGLIAINLIFPIVFYPWSKTIWLALETTLNPPDRETT